MEILDSHNVAILTTGGTIGSISDCGQISLHTSSQKSLSERIVSLATHKSIEVEITNVLNLPSPNFEPEHWALIANEISRQFDLGTRKFIITHGTDTLHYTSAYLSLQFANYPLCILITGAFSPMTSSHYDGEDNINFALESMLDGRTENGVYACFPATIGIAMLYL